MTNFKNYLIGGGVLSRTLITFALVLALVAVVPQPVVAQTAMTKTTLSSAITSNTQTRVIVASATGITGFSQGQPTTWIMTGRELMAVFSVSGTTLVVQRAQGGGSGAGLAASGAVVWAGPYNAFGQGDPINGTPCTSANLPFLPLVVPSTGNLWNCASSLWANFGTFAAKVTIGSVLTSAATLAPTSALQHFTGTTVWVTITPPAALPTNGGCITLIPDSTTAPQTTSTGGNIARAISVTANTPVLFCFDPGTAKWYPGYSQ